MTREFVPTCLKRVSLKLEMMGYEVLSNALREAYHALYHSRLDPETGLMPCGCGTVLEISDNPLFMVYCSECAWRTDYYYTKEDAVRAANRAMGYKNPDNSIGHRPHR